MKFPEGKEIVEGEIASYWFEDDILISYSKNIKRTVENISGNIELVKKITGNKPTPLLIYLTKSPVPDKETRNFSAKMIPEIYSAMAMVSKPGLSKFILNLLFAFQNPPIPMKSFSNDLDAKKWLKDIHKKSSASGAF